MIRVGTSGWSYDHWAGTFYPHDLPRSRWSAYYRTRFPVVEINATFYRLPRATTVVKWRDEARDGFRYVVKGSRYITHVRRLDDCADPVSRFLGRIAAMAPVTLAVLWQLPPDLPRDDERLERFLGLLPSRLGDVPLRHAVEFRHRTWVAGEVHDLLRRHDVSNVWVSSLAMPADRTTTSDLVYARFHGLDGGWEHDYRADELAPWVEALRAAPADGVAFFNNDGRGHAPANARLLCELLGDRALRWPRRPHDDAPPGGRDGAGGRRRRGRDAECGRTAAPARDRGIDPGQA